MQHDLTISRTISASTGEVFDAWLDSASAASLWSGSERLIINPVVDGLFYIVFDHEGRLWPHYGRFVRIDRPHRIEHTWVSEATHGLETMVTCTLESRGNRTEITLRHTGLPDAAAARQHEDGWRSMLSDLHDHVALDAATARRAT